MYLTVEPMPLAIIYLGKLHRASMSPGWCGLELLIVSR